MFSQIITVLFVSTFVIFAAATQTVSANPPAATTLSQCNTGAAQCCNSTQAASAGGPLTAILGLLNLVILPANVLVGLACTPITAIGVGGGANCAQQPVCCSNNNFNGVVNIGCTPISL